MRKLTLLLCIPVLFAPAAAEAAKKKPPKGPKATMVKKTLNSHYEAAYTESWMTDDQVTVDIKKLKVLKAKKRKAGTGHFDPYIWAWPVKTDIHVTVCRAPDECETDRIGWWSKDSLGGRTLIWFDRNTASRAWHWSASSERW